MDLWKKKKYIFKILIIVVQFNVLSEFYCLKNKFKFSFGIVEESKNLINLKRAMKSLKFQEIVRNIPNNSQAINYKILSNFRKILPSACSNLKSAPELIPLRVPRLLTVDKYNWKYNLNSAQSPANICPQSNKWLLQILPTCCDCHR